MPDRVKLGDIVLVRGSRYGTVINLLDDEIVVAIWKTPKEIVRVNKDVFRQSKMSLEECREGGFDEEFHKELDRIEKEVPSLHFRGHGNKKKPGSSPGSR